MKVKITTWQTSTLVNKSDSINDQPVYQRGKVWNNRKNALLIDSMLRGIDLPKIYLRKLENDMFDYEVADGQQRLNAINEFRNGSFALLKSREKGLKLSHIDEYDVGGRTFEALPEELKVRFNEYDLTIAVISETSGEEIRTLFGRLQEGETLNPAEKRNAIISKVRDYIDTLARFHSFFLHSRISVRRYKRQDYAAHALALVAYNNQSDLKANLILGLYLTEDFKLTNDLMKKMAEIHDLMNKIDQKSGVRIFKKYHYVDTFWHLFKNYEKIAALDADIYSNIFDKIESLRLKFHKDPSKILASDLSFDNKELFFKYVDGFKYGGANSINIDNRAFFIEDAFKEAFK